MSVIENTQRTSAEIASGAPYKPGTQAFNSDLTKLVVTEDGTNFDSFATSADIASLGLQEVYNNTALSGTFKKIVYNNSEYFTIEDADTGTHRIYITNENFGQELRLSSPITSCLCFDNQSTANVAGRIIGGDFANGDLYWEFLANPTQISPSPPSCDLSLSSSKDGVSKNLYSYNSITDVFNTFNNVTKGLDINATISDITLQEGYAQGDGSILLTSSKDVSINLSFPTGSNITSYTATIGGSSNLVDRIHGFTFVTDLPMYVTELSYVDANFTEPGSRTVQIYRKSDQLLISSVAVSKTDPLVNGFRSLTVAPKLLDPGVEYVFSVVVPANESFLDSVVVTDSNISVTEKAEGPDTSTPGFPSTFTTAADIPMAGGFQFKLTIPFENIVFDAQAGFSQNLGPTTFNSSQDSSGFFQVSSSTQTKSLAIDYFSDDIYSYSKFHVVDNTINMTNDMFSNRFNTPTFQIEATATVTTPGVESADVQLKRIKGGVVAPFVEYKAAGDTLNIKQNIILDSTANNISYDNIVNAATPTQGEVHKLICNEAIVAGSICKVSSTVEFRIEKLKPVDGDETGLICTAKTSTLAAGEALEVYGLKVLEVVINNNTTQGDHLEKSGAVAGRVVTAAAGPGTFCIALQSGVVGDQIKAAAIMNEVF